jgi:hypothetical protein
MYLLFDYACESHPEDIGVSVERVYPNPPATNLEPEWSHGVSKMVQSGGRMEMHLMRVMERGQPRYRVFPFHLESGAKWDFLKQITRSMDVKGITDVADVAQMIDRALRMTQTLLQTH